jgi:hypothetical protein
MAMSAPFVIVGGVPLTGLDDNPRTITLGCTAGQVLWQPNASAARTVVAYTPPLLSRTTEVGGALCISTPMTKSTWTHSIAPTFTNASVNAGPSGEHRLAGL